MSFYSKWTATYRRLGHRSCAMLTGCVLLAGCMTYTRQPIDGNELLDALEKRSPSLVEEVSSTDGLTLAEAEVVALFYNPVARAARLRAQVPVANARHAGRWEDPELSADVLRILEEVDYPWIGGAGLAFTIPVSGRLSVEKAAADAEGRVALLEAWATEQEVLNELRTAWIDWEAARKAFTSSGEVNGQLEIVVAITDRLEAAGELITAEAVAFRLAKSRAQMDEERKDADVDQAQRSIVRLMGLLPTTAPGLQSDVNAFDETPWPTLQEVLERNPGILVKAASYESAEESMRLEIRRQYPDVQLGPAYGNEERQHRLGLGFSIPLPFLNANRRAIAEATATRDAARAEWELAVQEALHKRAEIESRLEVSESRLGRLRDEVGPMATQQLEGARHLADQGEVDALLLLEALGSRRDSALELIEAEAEIARLRVAMQALAPLGPPGLAVHPVEDGGRK